MRVARLRHSGQTNRTTPRGVPGNEHCHLASAVVGELHEEVSRLLADVSVEHSDLQEIDQRGLVVQDEVEPHRALARLRALCFHQGREKILPHRYVARDIGFGFSFGYPRSQRLAEMILQVSQARPTTAVIRRSCHDSIKPRCSRQYKNGTSSGTGLLLFRQVLP